MTSLDLLRSSSLAAAVVILAASLMVGVLVASTDAPSVAWGLALGIGFLALAVLARSYSWRLVLFGTYMVLLYAGSRDFAYLGVPVGRSQLFVSEMVLIILGASLIPVFIRGGARIWSSFPGALPLFLFAGAIALVRGLPQYGLDAVRDSALCYYSLAFPLTILLVSDSKRLKAMLWTCWVGWLAAGAVVLWKYRFGMGVMLDYDLFRYGAGAQALASISSVGWAVAAFAQGTTKRMRVMLSVVGAGQLGIGILLIQHRSLFVASLGTALVVAYCCLPKKWVTAVGVVGVVFGILLLFSLVPIQGSRLPGMVVDTVDRIASIIPHEDANAGWRLEIWERCTRYALEHPLLGSGFGPSMGDTLEFGERERVDPHNSYIAILFRMGIPGLVAFAVMWCQVIGAAVARSRMDEGRNLTLGMALGMHMATAIFAAFNVVLEGPYMGIPFWVSLALLYVAAKEPLRVLDDTTGGKELTPGRTSSLREANLWPSVHHAARVD